MIEQALYFALGFALAGLVALGFAPVLWARALRLTRERLEARIPVSMREILADRDQLRAQFAVERRKLEQAMERILSNKAQDMSELGRRAAETLAVGEERDAARAATEQQARENAILSRDLIEITGQAGALAVALHDTHVYFERKLGDADALRRAHDSLEETLEARRATVAGLNTRVMGLEMTIEDAARARAALERQVSAMKQALNLVSDERDELFARDARSRADGSAEDAEPVTAPDAQDDAPSSAATGESIDPPRRRTTEGLASTTDQDDAALRRAIHDLGLAVAGMTPAAKVMAESVKV